MPDVALDLRYLKYALLAAEHGSFRRAAEMLSVSQSTVSRRIQILERRVGVLLFDRHRSGARPTPSGVRFLREASLGAKHLHQAVDSISLGRRGYTGVLRIGLMASLADGFLANLLGAYHRRFPDIELIFEEATFGTSEVGLLSGALDVAFMPGYPQFAGCKSERLWEERVFIAIPASHAAASLNVVAWNDVRREQFLVMADATGPETTDYLMRQLSSTGFRPRISVQRVGCGNILNMVARGFGLTVAVKSTVSIAFPGVRFIPVVGNENCVAFSAVWSASNQNPALKFLNEMSLVLRRERRGDVDKLTGSTF